MLRNNGHRLADTKNEWAGLHGIGMIVSSTQKVGEQGPVTATHYLMYSSAGMGATQLLHTKRTHWSVENSLHWGLDLDFGEDRMRMRKGYATENMNIMRHLALNLLKPEVSYKASVNLKRKKCMLSPQYLLKVFSFS